MANDGSKAGLSDLRALEIFVSVAESGSMTATARRLNMSQSGVSQVIRQLEQALGVALLDRSVRPTALTHPGHELHHRARRLLAAAADAAQAVRRAANVGEAKLRIGLVDSLAVNVGPALATRLRQAGGGCLLLSGQSLSHVDGLRRRELDLVITSDTSLVEQEGIAAEPLLAEPMVLVLPADYPHADDGLERIVADLELVAYSERAALSRQVALHLSRLRLQPRCNLAFDSTDSVFTMVGAGLGFAVTTPLCLLQGRERLRHVQIVPLPGPVVKRHLSVGYHVGEFDVLAKEMVSVCRAALRADALPALQPLGAWLTRDFWLGD